MNLKIFDSKLRKKCTLIPEKENTIRMYSCGPTVYHYVHIGNLRTFIFVDILRRTVQWFGYKIFHVMNITDVDDKTIRNAIQADKDLKTFTSIYKNAFLEDCKTLHIQTPEKVPEATKHIDAMIQMIQTLIDKDAAYVGEDGNVFFRISSFADYGKLSQIPMQENIDKASKRVSSDEYDKENVSDFVLWKAYDPEKDDSVFWESPWGKGRPGWHIECSAMAMQYLGETFDLHLGGEDLKFPHHENEIAQSEACTNKIFARHWMHSAHLLVDGKKMSKSLGNFYTLRDLLDKGYSGREIRYFLLSAHYRHPINFTLQGLDAAKNSLQRIDNFMQRIQEAQGKDCESLIQTIEDAKKSFQEALFDDLNMSQALASMFDFIKQINLLLDENQIGQKGKTLVLEFLQDIDQVLDCLKKPSLGVPPEIVAFAEKRLSARKNKQWDLADEFRQKIQDKGFTVEDTATGFTLKKV